MAKEKKQEKDVDGNIIQVIARNRKAKFEYEVLDSLEVGIVLTGTEVKSLRQGKAVLDDSFARIDRGEAWLYKCEIPEYLMGNIYNHETKRKRKLLLHRAEISKLVNKGTEKGFTLVPLSMYFKNGRAKVELGVCRGKQMHDKRDDLKKKDAKREIARAMGQRGRRS